MKELGIHEIVAGWATVPFYVSSDWHVSRQYGVLQKARV